jgi:ferredoxin
MTRLRNDYADTLTENRILYVPSCLIVEMLTNLHGQVATINLSASLHNITPDLLILLRRMRTNLKVTADAYEQGRIRYFIGDWRDDKLRARKLFFNIMSSLGYITELLERVERNMLFSAIEGVTAEWTALDRLMDAMADERKCQAGGVCSAFCDCSSAAWRRAMGQSLAAIHRTTDYSSVDFLILLCHVKAKRQLVAAVEDALLEAGSEERPDPDRFLAVSREGMPMLCRKCAETACSEDLPGSTRLRHRAAARRSTDTAILRPTRLIMPPSLASIGRA